MSTMLQRNVCTECGQLYYWCPHAGGCYEIGTPAQVQAAVARMLIAHTYDPKSTYYNDHDSDRKELDLLMDELKRELPEGAQP